MRSFAFAVLLLLVLHQPLAAQNRTTQLKARLATQQGAPRVATLLALATEYESLQPDSAYHYAKEALAVAKEQNDAKLKWDALERLGALASQAGNEKLALDNYTLALKQAKAVKDYPRLIQLVRSIARSYTRQGNLKKATIVLKHGRDIAVKHGLKQEEILLVADMAETMATVRDTPQAMALYNEALALAQAYGNEPMQNQLRNQVASLYENLNDYQQAQAYYQQALASARAANRQPDVLYNLYGAANSAYRLNQLETSRQQAAEALALARSLADSQYVSRANRLLGALAHQQPDRPAALRYYAAANRAATGPRRYPREEMAARLALGTVTEETGQWQDAVTHYRRYWHLKDSLAPVTGVRSLDELLAQHQAEQKLKENELLALDRERQEAQLGKAMLLRNLLILLVAVVLVFAIVLWNRFRALKRASAQLAAKSAEATAANTRLEEANHEMEAQNQRLNEAHLLATQRNDELKQANAQLQDSIRTIKSQQDRLFEQEKFAEMGKLLSSIAHEINSPVGAIKGSAVLLADRLPALTRQLVLEAAALDPADRNLLAQAAEIIMTHQHRMNTREEREAVRSLEAELEARHLPDADVLAKQLLRMGLRPHLDTLAMPLLTHPTRGATLAALLQSLQEVFMNLTTIGLSAESTQRIVYALKTITYTSPLGTTAVPVDLAHNLGVVLTIYDNQLKPGVEVDLHLEDVPPVKAFPDELIQVWTNLITNAMDAMSRQGTLKIYLSQPDSGHVRVQITDSGPGIPADVQEKIFNSFYTTKGAGKGTGLGLAIVKQIITKHGGTIAVASQPGNTTFTVTLPLDSGL